MGDTISIELKLLEGVLKGVSMFHPELKPLIDLAIKYEPQIGELLPLIENAVKEGPSALEAAEAKAPDLVKAIKDFANAVPGTAATPAAAKVHVERTSENLVRHVFGFNKMSPDQEKAWLDRATPNQDSRFGGG